MQLDKDIADALFAESITAKEALRVKQIRTERKRAQTAIKNAQKKVKDLEALDAELLEEEKGIFGA